MAATTDKRRRQTERRCFVSPSELPGFAASFIRILGVILLSLLPTPIAKMSHALGLENRLNVEEQLILRLPEELASRVRDMIRSGRMDDNITVKFPSTINELFTEIPHAS